MISNPIYSNLIERGASWEEADFVVVWYHGFGADARDCAPIADVLMEMGVPNRVRYLFPEASSRPCYVEEMPGNYLSWYDYKRWFPTVKVKPTVDVAIDEALMFLVSLSQAHHISLSRMVVGGFSQGGALALDLAFKSALALGGVAAMSCDFPLCYAECAHQRQQHIFIGHGTYDTMVPYPWKQDGVKALRAANQDITEHDYEGLGHGICREELEDFKNWLVPLVI